MMSTIQIVGLVITVLAVVGSELFSAGGKRKHFASVCFALAALSLNVSIRSC